MKRVLHLAPAEKFITPFIEFLSDNLSLKGHKFFILGDFNKFGIKSSDNVIKLKKNDLSLLQFLRCMYSSDKIVLHSLPSQKIITIILFLQPWLLKKCYWIIWGADLYAYNSNKLKWMWRLRPGEYIRRQVIKRIGHLVTYVKGDYELAQQWYSARGKYHECIVYPSNLYKEYELKEKPHSKINILVGNSADPSNSHLDVFEKLAIYKDKDILIYIPLSYGDQAYAKIVIEQGKKMFGDKIIPLTEFIPFEQYLDLLSVIDIAIFNHKRQQAMGNTITLLGLGKKVFMRNDVTQWDFFHRNDIKVFNIENFDLTPQMKEIKIYNATKVKQYFSVETYKHQLQELFN